MLNPSRSRLRLLRSTLLATSVVAGVGSATACATSSGLPSIPSPSSIPALEEDVARAPSDAGSWIGLGAAYVADGRPGEALEALDRASRLDPQRADIDFFEGIAFQELGRWEEAAVAYSSYAESLPPGTARDHLGARIGIVRREAAREAVRRAVVREAEETAAAGPAPGTVAVFPFVYLGEDPSLRPLGRALAHMLATDLGQTDRLTVLERIAVDALLDEVALGESDLVDPSTAARSGRILGAADVVQGNLSDLGGTLSIEAAVVGHEGAPGAIRTVGESDVLDRFYDVEVRLALSLFETLGISLTAAERERINRRPTESLQALLLFGRGLEAEARGRYREAADLFSQAASVDPGFEMAGEAAVASSSMAEAESASVVETFDIVAVPPPPDIGLDVETVLEQAGTRDPVQESLGSEGVGRQDAIRRIRIVFPRPGGGA